MTVPPRNLLRISCLPSVQHRQRPLHIRPIPNLRMRNIAGTTAFNLRMHAKIRITRPRTSYACRRRPGDPNRALQPHVHTSPIFAALLLPNHPLDVPVETMTMA